MINGEVYSINLGFLRKAAATIAIAIGNTYATSFVTVPAGVYHFSSVKMGW